MTRQRQHGQDRRRAHRSRGFTLIELMVVLGIISILATLAISMSANFVREQRLRGLARGLFSAMSTARAEAARHGATTMVRLELDGSSYAQRVVAFIDGAGGTAQQYDASNDVLLFAYPRGSDESIWTRVKVWSMRPTHSGAALAVFDSRGYCTDGAGGFASVFLCLNDEIVGQHLAVEATIAGATRVVGTIDAPGSCTF